MVRDQYFWFCRNIISFGEYFLEVKFKAVFYFVTCLNASSLFEIRTSKREILNYSKDDKNFRVLTNILHLIVNFYHATFLVFIFCTTDFINY